MQRFKNILLVADKATDDSSRYTTVERAIALAQHNQAKLKLVEVLEELPSHSSHLYKVVPRAELREMLIEHRLEALDKLVAPVRETGLQINTKVLVGTPFIEIIREVMRDQHDLLIKPATGAGGVKAALFASIDMNLMRECPCAVWIEKPTKTKKYARILAAVDPTPGDEEKNRLNTKIMELSTSLAESEHSELHVVHAWILYEEALLKLLVGHVETLAHDTRASHEEWLAELLQDYALAKDRSHVHLLEGKARDVIPMVAEQERVELIVMGTLSATELPRRLIGRTAENVLNRVDCSVLTVKPEGFVSPVTLA